MIEVTRDISLDESEIRLEFVRASGPGGQHVNKASTAVQLFFDVVSSPNLPEDVRRRLIEQAGSRVTEEGILVIEAKRSRSQEQNRRAAMERLVALIQQAAVPPKRRKKTRPSAVARRQRLEAKRRRSETKKRRQRVRYTDE